MRSTDRDSAHARFWQVDLFTLRLHQLALTLVLLCLSPVLLAQTLTQNELQKLLAADGASNDLFGYSVSLSGDRALVGAYLDDDTGSGSGSAYVFEKSAAGDWVEVAKLTASDAERADLFGWSVSLSGDRALVGAYLDDDAGSDSGSAYVFEKNAADVWEEVAKLTAMDAETNDQFGWTVSLLGDRALVGAYGDDVAGSDSGSAYVFEKNAAGDWVEVAKLNASDAESNDLFGWSVSLSGDRALVGAFADDDAGSGSGSAYVFDVAGLGDTDQDGFVDAEDNCPNDSNPLQENFDEDLLGDVCDLDDDNDGVDDLADAFPLDDTRAVSCEPGFFGAFSCTPAVLTIGVPDSGRYGFRYGDINNHREVFERQFDAGSTDLLLLVTGFDIDIIDEVRVLVNGAEIGFLEKTPNNGSRVTSFVIPQGLLNSTGNTLRFEQNNPGWRWGVTDLLLSELPPLVLDSVDSAKYGFRYDGINSHREFLERQFEASGTAVLLTVSGFDIDTNDEVRVLVNGIEIGFLSRTPNNGTRTTQLLIPQSLLSSAGNTLRFEHSNPGWKWGVTDLLLSTSDGGA